MGVWGYGGMVVWGDRGGVSHMGVDESGWRLSNNADDELYFHGSVLAFASGYQRSWSCPVVVETLQDG